MKKHLLTLTILIASLQVSMAQIATITTSSWTFSGFNGNSNTWQINVPGTLTDNLTITAYYFGDFSDPLANKFDLYGYDSYFGALTASGNCITTPLSRTFTMTKEEALESIYDNGYVYLEADLSNGTNDPNCTNSGIYFVVNAPNCETTIPGFTVPTITILSPSRICPIGLATLTVTPSGGQFNSPFITNNQFDAVAAGPGNYNLKYTYFDTVVGCNFFANKSLRVFGNSPVIAATQTVCNGVPFALTASGPNLTWYNDNTLGQQIGTSSPLTLAGISTSRPYFVASKTPLLTALPLFSVVTFTGANYAIIDHNILTNDDRAGIVTTKDFVYVVGDGHTGRFDKNDNFTNPLALPIHDAMFSDLATGDLFEFALANGNVVILNTTFPITISGINRLDADLNILSSISLSSPIVVGNYNNRNGIFQSSGNVLFYNNSEQTWYAIAIATGAVTNIGTSSSTNFYQNESWTNWGVGEFDGTTYSAMYRDPSSSNILKKSLPDGTPTIVGEFSDMSDMGSFTVDPNTNRWYFHFEGGSQFNGDEETLGYANAVFTNTTAAGIFSYSCPAKTDVTVDPCLPTDAGITTSTSAVETLIVPNPNTGTFSISSTKTFAAGTPFIVYNSLGSVMTQSILQSGKTEVSLNNLTSGIYYVKFTDEGNTKLLKFIVE